MGARYLTDLADVVRRAGLPCTEYAGWETRARSSGGYESGRPVAVMAHHTASQASPSSDANYMCHVSDNRPIANLLLCRDGSVWVLAAGATNTNGSGGPIGTVPADSMNTHAIGVEAQNDGVGEVWTNAQQDAYLKLVIALGEAYGINQCFGHAEYAPSRKIDPAGPARWPPINSSGTWDMNAFRADLDQEDDMPYTRDEIKAMLREVLDEGTGFGLTSWASTNAELLSVGQRTLNNTEVLKQSEPEADDDG